MASRPIIILQPVTARPRDLHDRLWTLMAKELSGTITAVETLELDLIFKSLDAGQDVAA